VITSLKKSQKQEQRLAKHYGGSVTPGSGNGWVHKNDVKTPTLSIEAKYTDAKSYSLKLADLIKAEKIALMDGRDIIFTVSFSGEEFVILREADYRDLHMQLKVIRTQLDASRAKLEYLTEAGVLSR